VFVTQSPPPLPNICHNLSNGLGCTYTPFTLGAPAFFTGIMLGLKCLYTCLLNKNANKFSDKFLSKQILVAYGIPLLGYADAVSLAPKC